MPQSAIVRATRWISWRTLYSRSSRADFAVEVLAADHVGGQLRPERGDFAVGLLEQNLAVLALDGRRADFPLDRVKGVGHVGGTEGRIDFQSTVKSLGRFSISRLSTHWQPYDPPLFVLVPFLELEDE